MRICHSIPDIRKTVAGFRAQSETVVLVTTQSACHAGHLALIERAKTEGQRVVVTCVGALNSDADTFRNAGVDAVFVPKTSEFFTDDAQTHVETTDLAKTLLGKFSPGHFRTVATAACKMFNIVQPDAACFGEKDYQQLCVIRKMVQELNFPIRIIAVPTMREADGIPASSLNLLLSPEDRAAAVILPQTLCQAVDLAKTGITASRLRAWVAAQIQTEARANPQSVDIRDAQTLATIAGPLVAPAVLLLAVKFGPILLIDHKVITP